MEPMTLAEKVACDFQRDRAPVLNEITVGTKRRQVEIQHGAKKDRAYHHLWFAFKVWIPRLEEMESFLRERDLADTDVGLRFLQTAEEMRALGRQVQEMLDG